MRASLAFLIVASATCSAGEKVRFFETWAPRPALRELWQPMCECWWNADLGMRSPRIAAHFKEYARHHSPEALVPEIFADLKAHDTELSETAYTYLLAQWPRHRVFGLLEPFRHSRDRDVRRVADGFHADLLEWKGDRPNQALQPFQRSAAFAKATASQGSQMSAFISASATWRAF